MGRRNAKGAEVLQRLLDTRGWSSATLQHQTRATEETISKWLAGKARPGRSELLMLAAAFGERYWDELLDAYGARELVGVLQARTGSDALKMNQPGPPGGGVFG